MMTIKRVGVSHNTELTSEVGALSEWRREIHGGKRSAHDHDPLWRAAVAEANARDYVAAGVISAANECRGEAAAIILEAYLQEPSE